LSQADIRVLALCLTFELEENGGWRVRDTPGQVLTGPPPKPEEEKKEGDELADKAAELSLEAEEEEAAPVASTSAATEEAAPTPAEPTAVEESQPEAEEQTQEDEAQAEQAEEDGEVSDAESDDSHSSSGSWITPDNVNAHKVKDLGLFTPPTDADGKPKPPKSIMKSAVLTGDFAMQNVALQMGLNVLGSGGKRVREVRTWVLRCHGCFK